MTGAQAPYARVPLADGTLVATADMPDASMIPHLLAASDVLGTGWYAADAAQADASGRAVRDAVTHHAASRDEQPRNLFREQRKHRCLLPADDFVAVHDRHRHRQVADVRGVARPRHHHRVDRDVLRRLPGLLRGLLCAVCGAGSRAGQ